MVPGAAFGRHPDIVAAFTASRCEMAIAELYSRTTSSGLGQGGNHHDDDLHELLTVEDVAALLKVSKSWVYEHTRSRSIPRSERLPYVKVGKYVRFEPRALRAFIEKQCRTTT
jgi:excisionase family DNA binding protein